MEHGDGEPSSSEPAFGEREKRARQYGQAAPVYAYAPPEHLVAKVCPVVPDRPARVQVEQARKLQTAEHQGEFNIWYGKYMGDNRFDKAMKAPTKCILESDAGLTRADYTSNTAHICLHFARGCCVYGKDCTYRHCAPTEQDESQADSPNDIFGRNRHGSFRDDMGGVGTWSKECKTLYVGRFCNTPTESQLTESVARHFGEWGPMESCRVLKGKGIAFMTYKHRCTAEFAKEAMMEQSLDMDEQINVRWAYDDPNPRAKAIRLRNDAQMMLAAMEAKGHLPSGESEPYPSELAPDYGEEGEAEDPATKRARGEAVPMTRDEHILHQRAVEEAEAAAKEAEAEAEAAEAAEARREEAASQASKLDAILQGIGGGGGGGGGGEGGGGEGGDAALADFLQSVGGEEAPKAEEGEELPPGIRQPKYLPKGWQEYSDPATGHPYFVWTATGHTTWARPHYGATE